MQKNVLTLFSLLMFVSEVLAQVKGPFPIMGWNGIPHNQTTSKNYNNLVQAGININHAGFLTLNDAIRAMDLAASKGIKIVFNCPEMFSAPEETARRVMNHPGMAGYFIADEPPVKDFDAIRKHVERLSSVDKKNICYVNLFPNYATPEQLGTESYEVYLDKFFSEVSLKIYSFDFYPVYNGEVTKNWYQNLEQFAKRCNSQDAKFWAFALTTSFRDENEIINIEDLRLQVFSNLVYGAQGIQFFTYWTPDGPFFNGPVSNKGVIQSIFNKVRIITKEIKNLSPIFMGAVVDGVYHTNFENGTTRYKESSFSEIDQLVGGNLILSKIRNGSRKFIIMLNKDLRSVQKVSFTTNTQFIELNKSLQASSLKKNTKLSFDINPGDILILEYL